MENKFSKHKSQESKLLIYLQKLILCDSKDSVNNRYCGSLGEPFMTKKISAVGHRKKTDGFVEGIKDVSWTAGN